MKQAAASLADLPTAGARPAINQVGFDVQVLSPFGWRAVGFCKPYATREAAQAAMRELRALDSMNREYRVYPALTAHARTNHSSAA